MPVAVARGEVHLTVDAGRLFAERVLDDAHRLHELTPVGGVEEAEAADAVADRNLVLCLLLALELDQPLDRQAHLGEPLLQPGKRHRLRGTLALQPAGEFGYKRAGHLRPGSRHVREREDQARRLLPRHLNHAVGPVVRLHARESVAGGARRDAAEVVDQRQAQHDRDRPKLAQLQRPDGLVGGDESAQAPRVDAAVAVGDELQRDRVNDGVAGRAAAKQLGKFLTVPLGQVAPGRPYLLLDKVEVVAQPLGGRSKTNLVFPLIRDQAVGIEEDTLVLIELREQKIRPPLLLDDVPRRELLRVLLELLEAEQLGAKRLIIAAPCGLDPVAAEAAPDGADGARNLLLPLFKPVCPLGLRRAPDCIVRRGPANSRRPDLPQCTVPHSLFVPQPWRRAQRSGGWKQ